MQVRTSTGLVPEWFQPDENDPARFQVRPLNGAEVGEVSDDIELNGGMVRIKNRGRSRCLALGLIGWEGITDENGNALAFSVTNTNYLPNEIRTHIVTHIMSISYLDPDTEKN